MSQPTIGLNHLVSNKPSEMTMRELKYTLCRDLHGQPLVSLDSPLGNGQDISPDSLRRLAAALTKIADEADANGSGRNNMLSHRSTEF